MSKAITLITLALAIVLAPAAMASQLTDDRAKADTYLEEGEYKKAFKQYRSLARLGDHDSQYVLAELYATGTGTKPNMTEAYGWAFVAAETGNADVITYSEELLAKTQDRGKAQRKGRQLMDKYGKAALEHRNEQLVRRSNGQRYGSCTGSRLACNNKVDAVSLSTTQGAGAPPVAGGGN